MLNFNGSNIGPTRASERVRTPKMTHRELAQKMLRFIREVEFEHDSGSALVDDRCALISPTSVLKTYPGQITKAHCVSRNNIGIDCKNVSMNKCKKSRHCAWRKRSMIKPSTQCLLEKDRERRQTATGQVERTCPICLSTELNHENRWGCDCGHAMCSTCFQNHVLSTGFKCPICNVFCDIDGYCRNRAVHMENVPGIMQPIYCPMCRAECKKCYGLDVRE